MPRYLVNSNNPAALSMAEKLTEADKNKSGYVMVSKAELQAQIDGDVTKVKGDSIEDIRARNFATAVRMEAQAIDEPINWRVELQLLRTRAYGRARRMQVAQYV